MLYIIFTPTGHNNPVINYLLHVHVRPVTAAFLTKPHDANSLNKVNIDDPCRKDLVAVWLVAPPGRVYIIHTCRSERLKFSMQDQAAALKKKNNLHCTEKIEDLVESY